MVQVAAQVVEQKNVVEEVPSSNLAALSSYFCLKKTSHSLAEV